MVAEVEDLLLELEVKVMCVAHAFFSIQGTLHIPPPKQVDCPLFLAEVGYISLVFEVEYTQ